MKHGFAEVNGTRLFYEEQGAGEPLVLIHGGLSDSALWDGQMKEFAKHYRVIRYDLRGFGESDVPISDYRPVDDLKGLLDFLHIEHTCLCGLSLGGMIALDFAIEYPNYVTAIISVASSPSGFEHGEDDPVMAKLIEALIAEDMDKVKELWLSHPMLAASKNFPDSLEKTEEMLDRNLGCFSFYQFLKCIEPPAINRLGTIGIPVLVMIGELDVPSVYAAASTIDAGVILTRKAIIANAGHHVSLDRPENFNLTVLDFLSKYHEMTISV